MGILILLSLTTLLFFSSFTHILCEEDIDEDLSFLDEPEADETTSHHHHHDDDANLEEDFSAYEDSETYQPPEFDENDVVILNDTNFTDVVDKNRFGLKYASGKNLVQSKNPVQDKIWFRLHESVLYQTELYRTGFYKKKNPFFVKTVF